MKIKELYQFAEKNGIENFNIEILLPENICHSFDESDLSIDRWGENLIIELLF